MPDPNPTTIPTPRGFWCRDCGGDGCCFVMNDRQSDTPAEMSETDEVLLLLNEAISLGRRDGMCGQHLGAMCSARDEIERLRARGKLEGWLSPMADHPERPITRRWRSSVMGVDQLRLMGKAEGYVMVRYNGWCAPFVISEKEWLALDPVRNDAHE